MLIGVELVQELVETTILTGRLKQHGPVSLVLIAAPENGKTSIVLERPCEAVFPLSDVTGRGLQMLLKLDRKATHLILNDMVAVMSHKHNVNRYLLSMLNAMTEEGIRAVAFPGQIEVFEAGKRGIIGCLPGDLARDGRAWWHRTGFSSRVIPFFYSYPERLILSIKAELDRDAFTVWKPGQPLRVPGVALSVPIEPKWTRQIRLLSDARAAKMGQLGIRLLKNYRALARGHAVRRGWKKPMVGEADLDFLVAMDRYVSWDEATPL